MMYSTRSTNIKKIVFSVIKNKLDHYFHLQRAQSQNGPIYIKPFLSPQPEVRVLDIENESIGDSDVLVMATDGLWDVVTNERVAEIVESGMPF